MWSRIAFLQGYGLRRVVTCCRISLSRILFGTIFRSQLTRSTFRRLSFILSLYRAVANRCACFPDYQGTLTRKSSLCCIGYLGGEHRQDRRDVGFLLEDTVDNCIIFSLKKGSLKSLSGSTSQSAYEPQRHTRQVQVCTSQRRGLASISVPWASWMAGEELAMYSNQMRAAETYLIGLIDLLVVHKNPYVDGTTLL